MLAALLLLSFVLLLGGPNEQAQLDGRWMLIGTVALTLVSAAAWTIAYRALNRRDKAWQRWRWRRCRLGGQGRQAQRSSSKLSSRSRRGGAARLQERSWCHPCRR